MNFRRNYNIASHQWRNTTVQSVRIMRCRSAGIVITLVCHEGDLAIGAIKCLYAIWTHYFDTYHKSFIVIQRHIKVGIQLQRT